KTLTHIPLLVLFNKNDLPNAVKPDLIAQELSVSASLLFSFSLFPFFPFSLFSFSLFPFFPFSLFPFFPFSLFPFLSLTSPTPCGQGLDDHRGPRSGVLLHFLQKHCQH